MTASSTSDRTQVIATLPSTVMAAAQRLKWNAIVVTSRAASGLGATGSDRVHRCPGSALRFLLLCLCTPFKTTGGLRTHRNGVQARQLAADFAEAPPESIRLEHLHRPAKGREKADRRLVRGKVEDDDAVTRSLHDLVPDKARERSGSLGVDAHLHEEVARTRSFEASHLGRPQRAKVEAGGPLERLIGNLRILDSRDAIDARRAIDAGEQVPGAGFAYQSVRFDDAFDDAIQ